MERTSRGETPVKVWAPLRCQAEERVVSGVNDPTTRVWPGESVNSQHRRSMDMPTTSDFLLKSVLTLHESLDYDDDQEREEREICEDGEEMVEKVVQQGKGGMCVNKKRSLGVLQDLPSMRVQCDWIGKKDSRVPARGSIWKVLWLVLTRNVYLCGSLGTRSYAGGPSKLIRGLLGGSWDWWAEGEDLLREKEW
ncbi:hypothetical protein NDU88_003797 [Pleurodeles waltl]|uniref:Uncharacterized protein n=1 Tax=Pleurodeles waltl TaxID=8319 RepID=A0AAV7TPP8_PLEWA|nr:hypothetical protein NDU88_003797 [Pleurodeles waltl]